jgi:superfamily II DNA or RNA helicase
MAVPEQFVGRPGVFQKKPIDMFFIHLFFFWRGGKTIGNDILLLRQARDKAQDNGYTWLAAEFSALLAALGEDESTNRETAARLHASCNTRSCVDIVRLQPQWEKTLNALLHLNQPGKERKAGKIAEQRMIWLFGFDEKYHFCHIAPRLQKLTAKGAWTNGRPMALKTLYRGYHDMPGLTNQDRQVCQAIKEEYFRSGWGHGQTEYTLNSDQALPAMVGHPLLFLEDTPEVNVELVLAEPELHIRKEKSGLKLTVTPSVTNETGKLLVIKDTPTRYKIFQFRPEHRQLIDLLGKGMAIPESGEGLVRRAVDALSPLITVHSDLEGANKASSVKADSRPHAHILPYRDGISLEFLIKPIGTGNSSFTPGKGSKNVMAVMDGKSLQAVRDLAEEKQRLALIIEACPTLNRLEAADNQWQVDDPEDSLELLLELKECGDDLVMEWPQGEKMTVRRQVGAGNFSLRIGKDRDWFKATGALTVDDELALDLRRLLEMLGRSTGRFIPLDDGTFLAITRSLHKRLAELQAYSDGHGQGVRFAPLAALALEDLTRDAGQLQSDKAWKEHCKRLAEPVTPPVPSTLRAQLRDYQATGFRWLARLSSWGVGACLADDMGLGKTVQALAAILLRASLGPTLVVAPLSVTSNWQEEAGRFAPTLNVIVFGPGDRKQVIEDLQPFDLLVVSYGLLPLEAELLASASWQTVVLDEAQAIKNMQTKRSRAAMGLRAECRIITTGTPLENHLGELWTLFNFLNPGLLGSFKKFNEKFAVPIERDQDKEARNHLRKLISPLILRRLKSDVLQELPAKTEITLEVEMSPEEQLLYEAQRQKALATINAHKDEDAGPQHLRILAELMKLRRLCCNPRLILPNSGIASSKLRVFIDTLHELLDNNHKALVFSQFVDHLGIIRHFLDEEKISYQYLDGSTPIKERKERIKSFQNGSGDVFLISLKAGGAGLNLTAADYVIHMDPWWNPAVEDQASDRVHRIGQERPVTVYRLVMKDTIEQQIVNLHKQKRDLADSLLEGTDAAGKISATELLALLHEEKM